MRRLTYFIASTIDGFIAAGSGEDPTGTGLFIDQGDHLDAVISEYPDIIPTHAREHFAHRVGWAGRPTTPRGGSASPARMPTCGNTWFPAVSPKPPTPPCRSSPKIR